MLELKHIRKTYKIGDIETKALDDISVAFREKEFVAILGTSGSGKTTCLNIIGGLDRYDSGDLIIKGKKTKDFKDSDWDAYRNNSIGFVFQSYNLIPHLSIVANVELGMTLSGVSKERKNERAIEVLEQVGLKDHLHKKPNQLSGGQMQRVAIARALANDPEILLCDEPTGALDTATSVQIMELIKNVAKDRLVIMVTHNPELAEQYADRTIRFKDGHIISDTNRYKEDTKSEGFNLKKTSMNFLTALSLSFNNIRTKKGRTFLTAFASSIGIIGIALVLALSNGFNKQIDSFESTTLSGFPIMINQTTANIDMEQMREQNKEALGKTEKEGKYPTDKVIYPYDPNDNNMIHTNVITDDYMNYIENIDSSLLSGVSYTRLVNMNMLNKDISGDDVSVVKSSSINFTAYPTNLDKNKKSYLEMNYDLLAGKYPKDMKDLVLIVDGYNKLDISVLKELGIDSNAESISFDDLIGHELKVVLNDDFYIKNGSHFIMNASPDALKELYNSENAITLKISGIIRANKDNKLEALPAGISYSDELSKFFIEDAKKSDIVKSQMNADYNVLTGESFAEDLKGANTNIPSGSPVTMMQSAGGSNKPMTKDDMLSVLGAKGTPYMISLYPTNFTAKGDVIKYLNDWNEGKPIEEQVLYTDMAHTFSSLSGGIMDAITLVLIAFAAVSLIVSLIMIGIITYISVLERTKEIGILRALGGRKKDITRVFNAETFIIGTFSGLLGIGIAYLLTIPVNIILEDVTDLVNVAQLNPLHAILLVVISVLLTMLGGAIPAKMASNKDPVESLRSE
ncbi:ABC transporter ATP-binding/permease protein [Gottschalkia acidurici 9a]|uniref:ABC transporter ATP-binding/permease protein n=1 Tax=Gottschalkia acidurici (strain ATCC 7906 / DSM 604 / BCRC 14475 / CIP 104303 / KCTC 5404 / NCIMB 10678 / 9a) TaxID=1128398 RepID=K0AYY3_GOTA9|nr:ABC transporter ATP-binding protein/permease [Gottschalkia acidurici]AFS77621.1 ABC transporter ATP-binding/permease protein [Gottschalkia acidurici 9a]